MLVYSESYITALCLNTVVGRQTEITHVYNNHFHEIPVVWTISIKGVTCNWTLIKPTPRPKRHSLYLMTAINLATDNAITTEGKTVHVCIKILLHLACTQVGKSAHFIFKYIKPELLTNNNTGCVIDTWWLVCPCLHQCMLQISFYKSAFEN